VLVLLEFTACQVFEVCGCSLLKLLDDDHKHIREALVIAAKKLHISNMSLERILSLYRKACTDSVPLCMSRSCMSQHVGSM